MSYIKDRLKAIPFYFLPHHAISWCIFKLARIRCRPVKNFFIRAYTKFNAVKMEEAVIEDKYAYEHLNAFFTRELKPECRPFDENKNAWLCPVDGAVSQSGEIEQGRIFQAKGIDYSLLELLGGDTELSKPFTNGRFATLYLSPKDYHRIHMCTTGTLTRMTYIPGRLFSVAKHTVNSIPRLFARNERCACFFDTEYGPMAMILVGAINVSAIETVWHGLVTTEGKIINRIDYEDNKVVLKRGQEMGRFNLGSTVIIISTEHLELDALIQPGREIKLGQCLGQIRNET
jgi:phosphatidylserine decarboxylase